jgi:DNA-directed RNA polymerase specialized sigma24 family protein
VIETVPNRGAQAELALTDFADRLERFFRDKYTALVRQHLRLGSVEDVQDAIQEAMLRIYARFAEGQQAEPDNLAAFVNVAVRNVLIDRRRRLEPLSLSDVLSFGQSDDDKLGDEPDPAFPDPQGLSQEDVLAWKQLLRAIFDRLPPKSVEIAAMVMGGKTPAEIGAAYRQDGYVLRRHARQLICKVLWHFAETGDPLARSVGEAFCAPAKLRAKI